MWVGWGWEVTSCGHKVSFWGDETALKLDCGVLTIQLGKYTKTC